MLDQVKEFLNGKLFDVVPYWAIALVGALAYFGGFIGKRKSRGFRR